MFVQQNPVPITQNRSLWTASELAMGRVMRAPDGHEGAPQGFQPAGSSDSGGNNTGVSSDNQGATGGSQDNSGGDDFDAESFWSGGDEATGASNPPDSATPATPSPPTPPVNQGNDSQNIGQQLMGEIEATKFEGVFSPEVAEKINNGDFEAANGLIEKNLKAAMRTSLQQSAKLMREFGKVVTGNVEQMISDALTGQKNSDYLTQMIPSAANPKVGPAIRAIYDQALSRAGGNREKAVQLTKQMMGTIASETAGDLNLEVAPRDPHARSAPAPTNWIEELAGR